jgi:hypothetical protein
LSLSDEKDGQSAFTSYVVMNYVLLH